MTGKHPGKSPFLSHHKAAAVAAVAGLGMAMFEVVLDVSSDAVRASLLLVAVGVVSDRLLESRRMLTDLTTVVDPISETRRDVRFIKSASKNVRTRKYQTGEEFFEALTIALEDTEDEVLATQIRADPPSDQTPAAVEWDQRSRAWATDGRVIRRVLSLPNERMVKWATTQVPSEVGGPVVVCRALRGEAEHPPAINFAVFDKSAVFIVLTREGKFSGIAIHDKETASYFADYFNLLWSSSDPVEEAIAAAKGRKANSGT